MAFMSSMLSHLVFAGLLGAGLFLPGWLLGRAIDANGGVVGAFIGSAALLVNVVIALDALGIGLTAGNLGAAVALVCAVLVAVAACQGWRKNSRVVSAKGDPNGGGDRTRYWWFVLPGALGLAATAFRGSISPLDGFDTYFRWDFLAQQMMRLGNLHFYPATTAADFECYGWCDGIAPLVSTLYFWSYASFGRIAESATAPIVVIQVLALFLGIYQLASLRGGTVAGAAACGLFASSSAALWGVSMGQETGLTALGLVAMFLFIEKQTADPDGSWLIWAGVAAGAGALAREYGMAFVGLGAAALAMKRTRSRGWVEFMSVAVIVAGPWYLRNWLKTGNPVWSHRVFDLFSVNSVHVDHMRVIQALNQGGIDQGSPLALVIILAGLPFLLGIAGALRSRRDALVYLFAMLAVAGLWLWSVQQTTAGYRYAIRVLAPAIAIGAVMGAPLVTRWSRARLGWLVPALLTVVAIDASARSFFLPLQPNVAWWQEAPAGWRSHAGYRAQWIKTPVWKILTEAAGGRAILVADPSTFRRFFDEGAKPISIFSPSLAFLFAAEADHAVCLKRLEGMGVRFIYLPRNDVFFEAQLSRHAFFRHLFSIPPAAPSASYRLYDLKMMTI